MLSKESIMSTVKVEQFGKDHWSMLAYVESCCVDSKDSLGTLQKSKVRCNSNTHPLLNHNGFSWKESWGTKLKGYTMEDSKDLDSAQAKGVFLKNHDDWDCLDDLEEAGFVEVMSLTQGAVKMTDKGSKVAAMIREHKSKGGMFANFEYQGA